MSLPATQLHPSTFREAEHGPWAQVCPTCKTQTQGGRPGLRAHQQTVHELEEAPSA